MDRADLRAGCLPFFVAPADALPRDAGADWLGAASTSIELLSGTGSVGTMTSDVVDGTPDHGRSSGRCMSDAGVAGAWAIPGSGGGSIRLAGVTAERSSIGEGVEMAELEPPTSADEPDAGAHTGDEAGVIASDVRLDAPPRPRPIGLRIGDGRVLTAVRDAPRPRDVVDAGDCPSIGELAAVLGDDASYRTPGSM